MKNKNTAATLAVAMSLLSGVVYAGQDRGGGDPLALEFKATAEIALKNMNSMKGAPFSSVNAELLQKKIDSAQILVSDATLSISQSGVNQDSAAENRPSQNLIIINRADYTKIGSAAVQQALALHEFLSLLGMESTGNYPISGQYLIAEGGALSGASQVISSATKSISTQTPCSEPSANVGQVFSMISDPATSSPAIQSFLQTHWVAKDALNDQCETMFEVTIEHARQDVMSVLLDRYKLNLSAPKGKMAQVFILGALLTGRYRSSSGSRVMLPLIIRRFRFPRLEIKWVESFCWRHYTTRRRT